MLEVRNLTKTDSRSTTVVDHVNFPVRAREITGYLGPNGSGKSTTVKMMTGLLLPSEGEIHFRGQNLRHDSMLFRQQLGYVPEEPNLYGYLTGLEYLQLAGEAARASRAVRGRPRESPAGTFFASRFPMGADFHVFERYEAAHFNRRRIVA